MPRLRVTRNSATGAAAGGLSGGAVTADPYFAQTRLLLHMDGSNGSTSFIDSSAYGHGVTTSGNAQVSSTQSKFGGSSAAFDGAGDCLTLSKSAAFDLPGDFTIEAWVWVDAFVGSNMQVVVQRWDASTGSYIFRLRQNYLELVLANNGVGTGGVHGASYSFSTNTWYHVAACRSGSTLRLFIDGNLVSTSTTTANTIGYPTLTVSQTGAECFNGYIDDLRITAAARYTSAFTAPTEAFPDGPLSTAWLPSQIANQVAWWDSTTTALFTYSTGSSVASWASRTGSYSLTQPTAASQPTRSGSLNGRTTTVFDGTNDFLSLSGLDLTAGGQAITMWLAGYYSNTSLGVPAEVSTPTTSIQFQGSNVLYAKEQSGNATLLLNSANVGSSSFILVGTTDGSLTTNETACWVNGDGSGQTYGYNANTTALNTVTDLYMGRRTSNTGYFPGQIGEYGIIAGIPSTLDRQKLEGYLAHKWGTSEKLPSNHPYKSVPPYVS